MRSASCERTFNGSNSRQLGMRQQQRPAHDTPGFHGHKRTSSVGSARKMTNGGTLGTPTATRKTYMVPSPPTRSLSAGGTVEFYRNVSSPRTPQSRRIIGGTVNGRTGGPLSGTGSLRSNSANAATPGKNGTWNGSNPARRQRANLFQAPYFGQQHQQQQGDSMDNLDSGEPPSEEFPDLAMWIKKALELDLDADKISHIEMAIKQFEQRREQSPEHHSTSLPYSVNNDSSSSCASTPTNNMLTAKTLPIRKRNDNGITKIPKPNFY